MSVVLPDPERPTIQTNSFSSMVKLISRSTASLDRSAAARPALRTKLLSTRVISRQAMGKISSGLKTPLDHAHEPVQGKADKPNGKDGQKNVRVNQAVVFLP